MSTKTPRTIFASVITEKELKMTNQSFFPRHIKMLIVLTILFTGISGCVVSKCSKTQTDILEKLQSESESCCDRIHAIKEAVDGFKETGCGDIDEIKILIGTIDIRPTEVQCCNTLEQIKKDVYNMN